MSLATSYSFQSGVWSGPITMRRAAGDPAFGPPTILLPNGTSVSNPLATTTRFAFATRAEGQFRLAGVHVLNLRVSRDLRLSRYRVKTALDVFNVGNFGDFQSLPLTSNQMFSTFYRTGAQRQLPRSVQVSVGLAF